MLADLTTTVVELVGFKKLMRDLSKELDSYKDKIQWTIDDYVNFLAERRRKSRLRFTERRTHKSFPRLSYKGLPSLNLDKPTLLAADKTIKKSKKKSKSKK